LYGERHRKNGLAAYFYARDIAPGEARISETIVGRVLELRIYLLFRAFQWSGGDGLVDRSYCSA